MKLFCAVALAVILAGCRGRGVNALPATGRTFVVQDAVAEWCAKHRLVTGRWPETTQHIYSCFPRLALVYQNPTSNERLPEYEVEWIDPGDFKVFELLKVTGAATKGEQATFRYRLDGQVELVEIKLSDPITDLTLRVPPGGRAY